MKAVNGGIAAPLNQGFDVDVGLPREFKRDHLQCLEVLYHQQQQRVRISVVDQLHKDYTALGIDQLPVHFHLLAGRVD